MTSLAVEDDHFLTLPGKMREPPLGACTHTDPFAGTGSAAENQQESA